jgi:hypothetical protein
MFTTIKRLLTLSLLLASTATAQQLVQVATYPAVSATVHHVILPLTIPNDAVVLYGELGNTTPEITDSQGNLWLQANKDTNEFQYVSASRGGLEIITITYAQPQSFKAIVAEFSGPYVLAEVVRPRDLPLYGGQSLKYNDMTDTPSSLTLTTKDVNELVIGYGNADSQYPSVIFSKGNVSAGQGWTLAGVIPNRYLQYTVLVNPGPIVSSVTQPFLPEGVYATAGIVAFKMGGCRQ